MANEKVTELPVVASATLADIIYAVQAGNSVQETLNQVFELMLANIILHNAGNPNGAIAGEIYQLCWDTTNSILYTCTSSGSSTTAVWTTAGSVTFPISLANGGTSKALTASNGGLVYSDASSMEILSGTATARQVPLSGSNAPPSWSTCTYPATTTINQLLYSGSANVISGLATENSAILATNSSGVPAFIGSLTNGQILVGSTGATPTAATLTAGSNIFISNGAGSITISATGLGGFSWTTVTGTSQNMVSNNGYIANNAGLVTLALPATSNVGDELDVIGKGAGGWAISQGAGQSIVFGSHTTTVGAGGSLSSTNAKDCFYMICTVANTEWEIASAPQGNLTFV